MFVNDIQLFCEFIVKDMEGNILYHWKPGEPGDVPPDIACSSVAVYDATKPAVEITVF